MAKEKILYVAKILLENTDDQHGMTISEIQDGLLAFGVAVERKALYGDIEALRNIGMDIEMRKGKDVRYHLASRNFEIAELKLLVDAVQCSRWISHKKSNILIEKIKMLASVHQARGLQRQVLTDNRLKSRNEQVLYTVDAIHEAMNRDIMISFRYFDWDAERKKQMRNGGLPYVVSPWALLWSEENYYLIAFDTASSDLRHFRVDKMQDILAVERNREGKELLAKEGIGTYANRLFGMYGGEERILILRCKQYLSGVMVDRFGRDALLRVIDEEYFELHAKVAVSPMLLGWLFNFGADVEILSPVDVRRSFVDMLQQVYGVYHGG